ncbi:MAG TPA: hypothetical protein VHZ24_14930 [Pirellulales bacterium]|jgi:hypothetical protein|nr:hypothetical protein [Pirellulales bacterium]
MMDIDFLPPRYREARAQRHAHVWRGLVLLGFGGLIGLAAFGQYEIRRKVEHESATVRDHYLAVQSQQLRLTALQQSLAVAETRAELLTYLRHPWPRTQILSGLFKSLPESITLLRVRIAREPAGGAVAAALAIPPEASTGAEKLTPSQIDLRRLQREIEAMQTVVLIDGMSADDTALHVYLSTLAECGMVAKAELTSLENSGPEKSGGRAQFAARVVIKPGYGQRGGPTTPPVARAPIDLQATVLMEGR